jgi:hypothetical protein
MRDEQQMRVLIDAVWRRCVREMFQTDDARCVVLRVESFVVADDPDGFLDVRLSQGYGQDCQHARWVITWEDIAVGMYASRTEFVDWVIENLIQLGDMVGMRRKPPPPPRWRVDFRIGTKAKRKVTDRLGAGRKSP